MSGEYSEYGMTFEDRCRPLQISNQNKTMYNSNNNQPPYGGKTTSFTGKPFDKSNYGAKGATTNDFPKGINFYPPHEKAPDFVKGAITIKRDEMMEWLSQQKDTVRLDVKESKEGNLYLAINTYEKKA